MDESRYTSSVYSLCNSENNSIGGEIEWKCLLQGQHRVAVRSAHALSVSAWISPLSFYPPPKKKNNVSRNIVSVKLPLCVKEHPIQSRVCSCLMPSAPGIGTECTTTLTRIKCLLKTKEWMNIYFNDMHTGWSYACWDFEDFFFFFYKTHCVILCLVQGSPILFRQLGILNPYK